MAASVTREFAILIRNEPGALGALTVALGKAGVNITGFCLEGEGLEGVLRLVTTDPARTEAYLATTAHRWSARDAVVVGVSNAPGELGRLASMLGRAGVTIVAAYANVPGMKTMQVVLAVDDVERALKTIT